MFVSHTMFLLTPSYRVQLKLLPEELNQILIITVVFSMALTPALAALGAKLGDAVDAMESSGSSIDGDEVVQKSLEVGTVDDSCRLR